MTNNEWKWGSRILTTAFYGRDLTNDSNGIKKLQTREEIKKSRFFFFTCRLCKEAREDDTYINIPIDMATFKWTASSSFFANEFFKFSWKPVIMCGRTVWSAIKLQIISAFEGLCHETRYSNSSLTLKIWILWIYLKNYKKNFVKNFGKFIDPVFASLGALAFFYLIRVPENILQFSKNCRIEFWIKKQWNWLINYFFNHKIYDKKSQLSK